MNDSCTSLGGTAVAMRLPTAIACGALCIPSTWAITSRGRSTAAGASTVLSRVMIATARIVRTPAAAKAIDAVVAYIDDPQIDVGGLMKHIKGPDFPTGGYIVGRSGIGAAYRTGRGAILMRAKASIDRERQRKGHGRRTARTASPSRGRTSWACCPSSSGRSRW